jgi:hypothetical protein
MSVATLFAVMILAAACGSSGTSPGGTGAGRVSSSAPASPGPSRPTPVLTVCQDVNSVRAALHSIVSVSITQAAVSEIQAVARGMEASVTDLSNTVSGREEWRTQIDAVKSDLARLQSAASSYAASPSTSDRSSVLSAKASVAVTARRLLATVGNRCPSPPATPVPSS